MTKQAQGEALVLTENPSNGKKMYIESYGCQMNFSDSEIVASILAKEGFESTKDYKSSDLILLILVLLERRPNKRSN